MATFFDASVVSVEVVDTSVVAEDTLAVEASVVVAIADLVFPQVKAVVEVTQVYIVTYS